MDRNIKAELSALRNEVLDNLKNLENLVQNIDNKLEEAEEVAVVARSPGLSNLLNQCQKVKWHADASTHEIRMFNEAVARASELWTVSEVERSERATNDFIALLKKIEERVPSTPLANAHDAYWEMISPGITAKMHDFLTSVDQPADTAKPHRIAKIDPVSLEVVYVDAPVEPEVDIDGADTLASTKNMSQALSESTTINEDASWIKDQLSAQRHDEAVHHQTLLAEAPAWAKDVDKKSTAQIFKEAADDWDDMAQTIFCNMWNSNKKLRIEITREVLAEVSAAIADSSYTERAVVHNLDDTKALMARYQMAENAKRRVCLVLNRSGQATFDKILATDTVTNFQLYYDWYNQLVKDISAIGQQGSLQQQLVTRWLAMLTSMLEQREYDVYTPMALDPITFDWKPMEMPQDKMKTFKKLQHANYMKDLKRAFEWIRQQALAEA